VTKQSHPYKKIFEFLTIIILFLLWKDITMKKNLIIQSNIVICFYLLLLLFIGNLQADDSSFLKQEFNLAGKHSQETQFYILKSELITYALNGKRISNDIFKLYLQCVPATISKKNKDEYTCIKFLIKQGNAPEVSVPALANWSYLFSEGIDDKNQVFGINHSQFENLKDMNGKVIPQDIAYHIYNAFIDFHSFCNVFAERTPNGKGIQDLRKIGQKIIHSAAFTEPPTNLGEYISKGSFFKNGEITLEFKGLSIVNDKQCALIGFDSGESLFKMIMNPAPNMEIITIGSSHYIGDIYKDTSSNWVQKVTLNEIVVSETTMPMPPNKINSVSERSILILNVSKDEFFNK